MKKFRLVQLFLSLLVVSVLGGCSEEDGVTTDLGIVASENILFEGNVIGNGDKEFVFTGTQTLKKGTYLLKGWVYVKDGAKLTIEPGTVIKGDKDTKASLIIEPGGQLFAQGTADAPIVMTSAQPKGSRRPGDWGGLIVCGKARNNQNVMKIEGGPRTEHGGDNDEDNSGVISYLRVEFAGYPFASDKEINGITFGSVGRGTKVDHLQVSYSNDDSYEWFGGAVNCKYLVAYHGWDDEFDTDNGFSGKVQFLLSVRDPRIADLSQSNGFESDNCSDGAAISPYTTAVFSNVTFIGPMGQDADFKNDNTYINGGSYNPNNGSGLGKFQSAMQVRRNSRLSCFNSVAIGYPVGLIIDKEKGDSQSAATQGLLKLQNLYFAGMGVLGSDANKMYEDFLVTSYKDSKPVLDRTQPSFSSTFFKLAANHNVVATLSELALSRPAGSGLGVDYLPGSGSVLLNGASFTDSLLSSFDKVNYAGAFSGVADNWMNGWTNFDPQNTDY